MALGRELVIKRQMTPDSFVSVCVTEARSLEINNEEIDITKPSCTDPGSKLLLSLMYGIQRINVQIDGAFVGNAASKAMIGDTVSQIVTPYQIVVPGVGTFEADFLISLTFSGDKTNELQCQGRMSATGTVGFTPFEAP
ncbi:MULTISPECIES: phage tail tube protein [Pseudochrobactrum]|uniref:Phage tail tube protein n=1 Tax=Pseudochrobactrum kiredjianiae TaxID=386305 RepID=A0ABW3V0T6_9HYPH|nr:phage tail tube protein [Pseudochrobactrum kiredjianiae]MDM7851860.1 phage tail protein [Pseudochrobactrum kiredjianiae]